MAPSRDLAFPVVIVCLVLIRGYTPLPMTSQVTGRNPMRPLTPHGYATEAFLFPSEDYSQYEDAVTPIPDNSVRPYGETPERCAYDPCLESHISCADLAANTSCLCPGFTLHNEIPEAPLLKSVSWNGSEVIVQWCAPHSYVTAYTVTVGGEERQTFGKDRRSGRVGEVEHIAEVCVVAVNDVGDSEGSCLMYQPGDSSLPLKAGLIGGALGFLLLLLLALLLWRHRRQRKQEASISMHDTAERQ